MLFRSAYQITNVIYIIVCIPLILCSFLFCKETVVNVNVFDKPVRFSESLGSLVKNPMLLLLVVSSVLGTAASLSRIGTQVYYYQHSLQRADLAGTIMVAYQVGQFLVPFVVPALIKVAGKKMSMIIANLLDGGRTRMYSCISARTIPPANMAGTRRWTASKNPSHGSWRS